VERNHNKGRTSGRNQAGALEGRGNDTSVIRLSRTGGPGVEENEAAEVESALPSEQTSDEDSIFRYWARRPDHGQRGINIHVSRFGASWKEMK